MAKPTEIAEAFSENYKNRYDESELIEDKTQAFLKRIHLPSLSVEEASEMTWTISLQEISNTINTLKTNKYPGTDGFLGEFYKCFAEEISI